MEDVYVTGLGIIAPTGHTRGAVWHALVEGRSGVGPVTRFSTDWLGAHIAAEVGDFPLPSPYLSQDEVSTLNAAELMSLSACRQALEQGGLLSTAGTSTLPRLDVFWGSNMVDYVPLLERKIRSLGENADVQNIKQATVPLLLSDNSFHGLSVTLAGRLRVNGRQQIISNACSSGAHTIALGAERIRQGRASLALCGSVELLSEMIFAGFSCLRSLAPDCCRPFDKNRQGLVLGEAAAALLLESGASCRERGAVPLARLAGWGFSADAHHLSAPHPEGLGTVLAMRRAQENAGLIPTQIDCLVAHGTGTPSNDRAEALAFQKIFPGKIPPVTAPKSTLGHSLSAASAVEALAAVLITQTGTIPPTMNYATPDPDCPLDCVPNQARQADVTVCQTNASSFGGNNASLVFARPEGGEAA